jgi:2,4-dienoyl-CoA reductase-like NADH-dependent reductase (Old Yellow Enzyme family)
MFAETTEKSARTKAREAFFLEFARVIRDKFRDVPLIVTGGFRSRGGMEAAVQDGACEMVGIGRPAALNASIPKDIILNKDIKDDDAWIEAPKIESPWILKKLRMPVVAAGAESVSLSPCPMESYTHTDDH